MALYLPPIALGRWILPVEPQSVPNTSQTFTAGRVQLVQFVVSRACVIDGLAYTVGTTAAGNVTGGIVGPVATTADSAVGAAVVAQSASTAQATQSTSQVLTWTGVAVRPGIYYAALEGDNATGTYMRMTSAIVPAGLMMKYDRGGGYGTLTDPTPAVTEAVAVAPGLRIRLAA